MERVIATHISKKFLFGDTTSPLTARKTLHQFWKQNKKHDLWALRDISFTAHSGEIIGIIGKNAAGKSTLLSMIAHILEPSEGEVITTGKVVPVIGLGRALHDRLTMEEGITLCGALLGIPTRTMQSRSRDIIRLAQLTKFSGAKLHQFSLGMVARLVFSIAIHCDPDIILLDEITANIDDEFIKIATKVILDAAQKGATVFAVSHKPDIIRYCDRVIWLEQGEIKKIGSSADIVQEYWHTSP